MKKTLTRLVLVLLASLLHSALAIEPPPSGTNAIVGVVQFVNVDPDILARLGPPGDEGMTDFAIFAYSDPPDTLQSSKAFIGVDKLSNPYPTSADGPQKFFRVCVSGDCAGAPARPAVLGLVE